MFTASARLTYYIPHSFSLKDKRQVRRSLVDRARHKFNASIAEVGTQDVQQTLTIGVSVVSGSAAHAQAYLEDIVRHMRDHADAELTSTEMSIGKM